MKPAFAAEAGISPIEKCCAVTPAPGINLDTYTNVDPIWHPPGARGIYGGAAIAQCLNAAYETVAPDFVVHSMHCHFLLAGNSKLRVHYSVERIRDGRSFITRSVRAFQGDVCFFTTMISFQKMATRSSLVLTAAVRPPVGARSPGNSKNVSNPCHDTEEPFETVTFGYAAGPSPASRKPQQWIRAHGSIVGDQDRATHRRASNTQVASQRAHIVALAYMSDSDFINTVSRVHRLVQFSTPEYIKLTRDGFHGGEVERLRMEEWLQGRGRDEVKTNEEAAQVEGRTVPRRVGMLVSLNHTIFFHNHHHIRADEWLFSEMGCPWTGDERGVVTQHVWTADGVLVATCIQEGVVRVAQEDKGRL